ncbi:MAG TPA: hypothetical protein VER36_04555 [Flavisolibacter sp.]|nr:hypothetical protein [Flavisolibacter sp.]
MKRNLILFLIMPVMLLAGMSFILIKKNNTDSLTGAWQKNDNNGMQVLLIADGYLAHTTYDKEGKKFIQTRGGTYTFANNQLTVQYEFDTKNKEQVGQPATYQIRLSGSKLTANINGKDETWERTDDGQSGLSGLWKITARKQGDSLQPIHQAGTRKTVKILTATRFQWAAIDPGTKSFMGTGGGSYTFKDGKYTENIEFFSRDSSRVGSSLSFNGKLENGDWHHSGLSSRGDPIYEVWSRRK